MRHACGDFGARKARKMAVLAAMAGRGWGDFAGPFGSGGRFGGAGGPRGGRGRGRRFGRGELRLMLLRLIGDQPRHGYDLIKAMEELSGGHYAPSPGVVYPALSMLADEGLVAEQQSDDQRRRFAITPAGEAVLLEEAEGVEAAMHRLAELGERAERNRAPSIERASANLFAAVGQRLLNERDADLPHRIAEILDDAARKIERL